MMILFWVLIIVGIVYLVRAISNNNNGSINSRNNNEDNAINIARERYARGEINKEELDKIHNDLK